MRRPWLMLRAVFVLASLLLLVAPLELVEIHGPDGQSYWINPKEISSLRQPTQADLGRYFPRGTKCVISTSNGKFITAIEDCRTLRDELSGGRIH